MLARLIEARLEQFSALADAWLSTGATAFEVWEAGHLLRIWPSQAEAAPQAMAAPIRANGRPVGELRISGLDQPNAQARLMVDADFVASMAAVEGELNELVASLVEAQDKLMMLYEFSHTTFGKLDVAETLEAFVQQARRLTGAAGAFFLLDAPALPGQLIQHPAGLVPETLIRHWDQAAAGQSEGQLWDTKALDGELPQSVTFVFIHPLSFRGQPVGALGFLLSQSAALLAPDLKLARVVVEQAQAYIETVLLHQESLRRARLQTELGLARETQTRLLPQKVPMVPGMTVAAVSLPADEVGGDFYNFISRPGALPLFIVGDVAGKGFPAALMMATSHYAVQWATNTLPDPDPAALLSQANHGLYDAFTQVGSFATICIAQVDPERRLVRYANAGHSPVVYCPAGGPAQLLEADGPALGVLPISLSENQTIAYRPGDVFLMGSDGLTETQNSAGEMLGYDRFLEIVWQATSGRAESIVAEILQAVRRFEAGAAQVDDQTLLVIQFE